MIARADGHPDALQDAIAVMELEAAPREVRGDPEAGPRELEGETVVLDPGELPVRQSGVGTPNESPLTCSIQKTRMDPNSVLSPTRSSTFPPGEA